MSFIEFHSTNCRSCVFFIRIQGRDCRDLVPAPTHRGAHHVNQLMDPMVKLFCGFASDSFRVIFVGFFGPGKPNPQGFVMGPLKK